MEMLELNWNPTDKLKNKNALFGPNLQPPTQQQERTFARVGTEKVFALRARTPPLPLYSWSGCLSTGRETRLGWQMYQNCVDGHSYVGVRLVLIMDSDIPREYSRSSHK